jgi:hypothetical protein
VLAPGISRNSKNWRERERACVKGAQKFENSTGRLSGASSGSRCRHAAGSRRGVGTRESDVALACIPDIDREARRTKNRWRK